MPTDKIDDRAALDAQYNLRAAVPEHPHFFARWARDSAATRERLRCRPDLGYGRSEAERLNFFPAPGRRTRAPLLAFVHGGYWQALDARDFDFLAPAYTDYDIAYASLNYGLAPSVELDEIIAHCRAALAWLWRQADRLGLDRDRFYLAGHSAGGHLSVMMMLTDWPAFDAELPADLVKGGCAVSGVFDLEPVRHTYLNDALGLDEDTARRLSPIRLLDGRADPGPLILAVGERETEAFRRQQADFAAAWRGRGFGCDIVALPDRHHFSAVDALGEPGHPLAAAVRAMLATGPQGTARAAVADGIEKLEAT